MKSIPSTILAYLRKILWAIIVSYMLGMHNFYKGEDKTTDDVCITIECDNMYEDEWMSK
jgi:hypothetical protein